MADSDEAYQQRFREELMRTIMRVSIVEQEGQPRMAMLRSYELIDSMLSMIALLSSTSVEASTPSKTRALCDEIARKLQRRINSAKEQPSPFDHVISGVPN